MKQAHTENRNYAVALMAVLHDGERARELAAFVNESDRAAYEGGVAQILDSLPERRLDEIKQRLRAMTTSEGFSGVADIHPAWILEVLKDETPRIMGIVMRYLPSRQVRYVIEHLPPEVASKIPTLIEAFAVPRHVLDVVRRRFESHFLPVRVCKTLEKFEFEHLHFLKGDEFEALFVELGMCEMAMALDGLPDKMLDVVLNRLELKDARRLHERMGELKDVSREMKQRARFAILEADDEQLASGQLLRDIGISCFAQAMNHGGEEMFALIRQKLSPHLAYALKRKIEECSRSVPTELADERRMLVLRSIARLAVEERIEVQWRRFSPDLPGERSV